jgi:hypothetical protein
MFSKDLSFEFMANLEVRKAGRFALEFHKVVPSTKGTINARTIVSQGTVSEICVQCNTVQI